MSIQRQSEADIRKAEFSATREAEMALIGSLLIEGTRDEKTTVVEEVKRIVSDFDFLDAHFHDNKHSRIFQGICQCQRPHWINVSEAMNNTQILRPGDIAYMSHCISRVPCSLDYIDYAKAVSAYSLKRQIRFHTDKGNFDKVADLSTKAKHQLKRTRGFEIEQA